MSRTTVTVLLLSRYELVLYFKFNRLHVVCLNISYLGVFLHRVGAAILCNVFYKDKLDGNVVYNSANLSINVHCEHNSRLFYLCNNNN